MHCQLLPVVTRSFICASIAIRQNSISSCSVGISPSPGAWAKGTRKTYLIISRHRLLGYTCPGDPVADACTDLVAGQSLGHDCTDDVQELWRPVSDISGLGLASMVLVLSSALARGSCDWRGRGRTASSRLTMRMYVYISVLGYHHCPNPKDILETY